MKAQTVCMYNERKLAVSLFSGAGGRRLSLPRAAPASCFCSTAFKQQVWACVSAGGELVGPCSHARLHHHSPHHRVIRLGGARVIRRLIDDVRCFRSLTM